jgi:DNA topoisomerase-1
MTKNLVIVESPAKARTVERYLGEDHRVPANCGLVRDLPENPGKGKLGVDVDHDFAPQYEVPESSRRHVAHITRAAKSADTVFLATDLDREGAAIAWHVAEAAGMPATKQRRVTFNEITEGAIREAFAAKPAGRVSVLRVVQDLLGHASLGTTQVHAHVSTTRLRSAYRAAHPRAARTSQHPA